MTLAEVCLLSNETVDAFATAAFVCRQRAVLDGMRAMAASPENAAMVQGHILAAHSGIDKDSELAYDTIHEAELTRKFGAPIPIVDNAGLRAIGLEVREG